jgi:serine/threonine protein kinase
MNNTILGRQIDEYRLEALLGQGGMARVYRGRDVHLNRYVALKVIDTPFRNDSEYILRFEREAQAVAQLEHSHIVRLYRYGNRDGLLYMAMQYVEGASLETILEQYEADGEQLEPEEAARIIEEICLALDYAHGRGVIHRDVKPANVMLDRKGRAIVADFGLALLTDLGTRGEVFGTPQYIAPEQAISSAGATPRSDFYSVGVMLYRIFTGVLPFDGADPLEVAMRHMAEMPRPPRQLQPNISPRLEAVILKSLAKEAADRYANGRALAEALRQALAEPQAAPSLLLPPSRPTIADRVASQAEDLPPLPAGITPPAPPLRPTASHLSYPDLPPAATAALPAPAAVARPATRSGSRRPAFLVVGAALGLLLLCSFVLLLSGAFWLFNRDEPEPAADMAATGVVVAAAPANDLQEQPPAVAPEAAPGDTAALPESTVTAVAGDSPAAMLWLPLIAADNHMDTPVAASPYRLLIARNSDDSLFIVNQSERPFPLAGIHVAGDGGAVDGAEWGVAFLPANGCVTLWKAQGNPQPPAVNCESAGARLTRAGREIFWKDEIHVYYDGARAQICRQTESSCLVLIEQ